MAPVRAEPPGKAAPPVLGLREYVMEAPVFGGSVYVVEAGSPSAPPLVLIHGLGDRAARDFAPLLPELSTRYRVLSFDLPGFGRSTRAPNDYTPERYAAFVEAMIAQRVGGPAAVLGHSMGGAIALLHASRYPASVTRLLLLDVAGIVHYRSYARELMGAQVAGDGPLARPLRGVSDKLFGIASWPVAGMRLETLELNRKRGLMPTMSSSTTAAILFVRYDFGAALRSIRAPTWIGWGAHDKVAPRRTAETLRYLLKPETFELFRNSGHVPMASEPALLLQSLRRFLESTPLPPVAETPLLAGRSASCRHQADLVFEGDYEHIEIEHCTRVLLRNVRARSLHVVGSRVELVHVKLVSDRVALVISGSEIQWTGGGIWAPVCVETTGSELDVMGFACVATQEPFLVHSGSRIFASVSEVWRGSLRNPLHGIHPLQPALAPR